MSDEEYVRHEGCVCPLCGSDNIEGDEVRTGTGTAVQDMYCNACGGSWCDEYKLVGYSCEMRG